MKKLFLLFLIFTIATMCAVGICAKEIVILEDDFSYDSLYQYDIKGNWNVDNGMLNLGSGSGSAFLYYNLPAQYENCNYKVEVDFIGHTSTGGILIGGAGSKLTANAVEFHGYNFFTGNNGKKAALGCYKEDGTWSGNFIVGDDIITVSDIHLSVEVYDDEITCVLSSLDGETVFYGVNYKIGTASRDVYEAFFGRTGLRKFYADKGSFDNFKVTVYEDDKIPSLGKKAELGGFAFKTSSGMKQTGGVVSGKGALLTESSLADNFKAEFTLAPKGISKIFFGMTDVNNGYAFEINESSETLAFYQIKNGEYHRLGVKNMPVYEGEHFASVEVTDKVATVTFDAFFENENAFWSFSFRLDDYKAGKFGAMLDGGSIKSLSVIETDSITGETYTNPVNWGPDPDVLFYDGTYYLYNRITSGDDIFRVYTSSDMTKWVARDTVFVNDPSIHNVQHYMSPNVMYYDGTFYLFYAAKNSAGSNRLYCATSDSPYGPFTHKHGQIPLHDVPEIGGHPYFDEDTGKVYMTYVRFGNGNHIWIEEVTLADDKAIPVPGTLTKIISPTREYENDGYGHISEGGVLYKHNGYYYMIYATGHYEGHYGESYAISKDILGPYVKYEYNDILTWNEHINGTGDGVFVKSPDGQELYMVYHKHYTTDTVPPRYTCIDKIKFVKDPNGGPDILTVQGPSTTPQAKPSNIYRYDIDRDGVSRLMDAMQLLTFTSDVYSGSHDVDGNNRNDEYDVMALIEHIVK